MAFRKITSTEMERVVEIFKTGANFIIVNLHIKTFSNNMLLAKDMQEA